MTWATINGCLCSKFYLSSSFQSCKSTDSIKCLLSRSSLGCLRAIWAKTKRRFTFNLTPTIRLKSSKYIKELKLAASNTSQEFFVNCINFSVSDFWELVVSAKNVKKLCIQNSKIPLDSKFEFSQQLDVWDINYFDMYGCGDASNSDWTSNPQRLDNLLEAISKWVPFKNSLKTFYIKNCGISKEKVEEISKKYGLNEFSFTMA